MRAPPSTERRRWAHSTEVTREVGGRQQEVDQKGMLQKTQQWRCQGGETWQLWESGFQNPKQYFLDLVHHSFSHLDIDCLSAIDQKILNIRNSRQWEGSNSQCVLTAMRLLTHKIVPTDIFFFFGGVWFCASYNFWRKCLQDKNNYILKEVQSQRSLDHKIPLNWKKLYWHQLLTHKLVFKYLPHNWMQYVLPSALSNYLDNAEMNKILL